VPERISPTSPDNDAGAGEGVKNWFQSERTRAVEKPPWAITASPPRLQSVRNPVVSEFHRSSADAPVPSGESAWSDHCEYTRYASRPSEPP
jgi:hypothetical protein